MLLAALQIRHFIYFARAFIFSARTFTGSSRELGRIPPRVLHFSALVVMVVGISIIIPSATYTNYNFACG